MRELPRGSYIRSTSGEKGSAADRGVGAGEIAIHRKEARSLAREREDAQRAPKCAVRRLWAPVPALCDAVRSPERRREAIHGYPDHQSKSQADPRRSEQVRYRLCELPPPTDLSAADGGTRE